MSGFSFTYSNDELRLFATSLFGRRLARVTLPAGLVRVGRINNPDLFAQTLAQAMASAVPKPITAQRVTIGLPEEQAFVKLLELPDRLSAPELRTAVEYQWQNVLPIPIDQVYYDCAYLKVEAKRVASRSKTRSPRPVLVVAYPRDVISTLLVVLRQRGLEPDFFIPTSFGYARLFSPATGQAAMLIDTPNGQDIVISIVKDDLTLFSTTLHTSVDDPKLIKQIDNLRQFYTTSTGGRAGEVASLNLLPNPYTENLKQTLGAATIPVTLIDGATIVPAQGDSAPFIPLVGLLKHRVRMSILPPELLNSHQVKQQLTVLRTLTVTMLATLTIVSYFSFVFLLSLQLSIRTKVQYSTTLANRVVAESQTIGQEVTDLNAKITRLVGLEAKRTHMSDLITDTYAAAAVSHITISRIDFTDTKTVFIDATAANQSAIAQFITDLKNAPLVGELKQEVIKSDTADSLSFRLAIILKGAV